MTDVSPADDSAFGPGDSDCNAGAGNYGVEVTATIDQAEDREIDVLLDGTVVADNVTITDTSITFCVAAPDGESGITVRATAPSDSDTDEVTSTITVNRVAFTDPVDTDGIGAADDCDDTAGFGYQVVVAVDPSLDGETYTIDGGLADLTGTVAGTEITGCLALEAGTPTLTATVGLVSTSIMVTVYTVGPTEATGIVIDDLPAPDLDSATHREGVVATWPELTVDFPGQFVAYELRCAGEALDAAATLVDKELWWDETSSLVELPEDFDPSDEPTVTLPFRPEEPQHCLLRAFDVADQGTAITQSTDLTLRLRSVVLSAGTAPEQLGWDVEPIGDFDDDGFDDFIASGWGSVALYYGGPAPLPTAPDVELTSIAEFEYLAVAGIGDFNDDGFPDFAIADGDWVDSGTGGFPGRTSVFFGGPDRTLLGTVDISDACVADLCFTHDEDDAAGSNAVAAAGDFDADGIADIAIGNHYYQSFAADGQLVIVSGGAYEARSCSDEDDCRANESCGDGDVCELDDPSGRWNLEIDVPSGTYSGVNAPPVGTENPVAGFFLDYTPASTAVFGTRVVGLGDVDGVSGADLAVSATGGALVHLLSGRARSVDAMDELTTADLGARVAGVPNGQPITAGSEFTPTQALYGHVLGSLGNFYDPPGAGAADGNDLAVAGSLQNRPRVVPSEPATVGGPVFTSAEVGFVDMTATNLGESIANGYHAAYGLLGDLNNDGVPELCMGTRGDDLMLWYADTFAAAAADAQPVDISTGISVPVDTSSTSHVQYVGDINGDGYADIAVGDPGPTSGTGAGPAGRVFLLY